MKDTLDDYIAAHCSPEPELLHELYRDTNLRRLYPRMCSGHVQGRLLKMIAAMVKPRRVIELGTYSGYSALCLAEGLKNDSCEVHTVEIDDEAESFIREWLDRSPYGSRVRLHIGDALEVVPEISSEPWDLAYIDANKRNYPEYLEMLLPLMRKGSFIIADNTLWSGKVNDASAISHDAQGRGVARFNDIVACDPRLETVILPVRDGLTLLRVV